MVPLQGLKQELVMSAAAVSGTTLASSDDIETYMCNTIKLLMVNST